MPDLGDSRIFWKGGGEGGGKGADIFRGRSPQGYDFLGSPYGRVEFWQIAPMGGGNLLTFMVTLQPSLFQRLQFLLECNLVPVLSTYRWTFKSTLVGYIAAHSVPTVSNTTSYHCQLIVEPSDQLKYQWQLNLKCPLWLGRGHGDASLTACRPPTREHRFVAKPLPFPSSFPVHLARSWLDRSFDL